MIFRPYKYIENGIITNVGESRMIPENGVEITAEEKAQLEEVMAAKPADTLEHCYRLSAETEQYEPYPRTHEETVAWYVEKVGSGEMTLAEVPADYRKEVEAAVQPAPTPEQAVIDGIMQEVSNYEY